jgi:tetratricopeptide (TPR) repeat protein
MSHRSSATAGWSEPIPLGATVNTQHDESGPRLSSDGRALLFNSDRPGGQGYDDLWMSRGASAFGPWSKPVNLGPGLNAGGNDKHASFAEGGRGLVFESGRAGNLGRHDLWMATRTPKIDHVQLANEHAAQGRLDEAAREFSLALNSITDRNPHGSERARIVEQFILTDEIFARVVQLRPEDINLWSHRANHLAKAGRWEESVACFQKRLELGPDGSGLWQVYSLALLAKHDDDAFRSLCEQMLAAFANNSNPGEAAHAALAMAVIPDAVQDKQQAFQLAERAVNGLTNDVWWISATYGAWLYRFDRLEEALIRLESAKDQDYQGFSLCFLAMAHHRLGHLEEAGRYANLIRQKQTEWTDATTWYHRVRVERLMVEMDAVLDGEPREVRVPPADEASALPIREDIDTDGTATAEEPLLTPADTDY